MHTLRRTRLTEATVKSLIKEVKKRKCLWDTRDEHYNDRISISAAWAELTALFKIPAPCLRLKWKNIRDLYKRETKKFGLSTGQYTGKWRHYDGLRFLDKPIESDAEDDKNTSTTKNDGIIKSSGTVTIVKKEIDESDEADNSENVVYYLNEVYQDPLREKRIETSTDDEYDIMFLKSLAPFMKQLNPISKLVVRNKIQDMLLNEIAAQSSSSHSQSKKS